MHTILVIDDEAALRRTIVRVLQLKGFRTLEADCGHAGIEQTRQHLPDLIISDVTMERGDGYEALRALRQHPETAAIPFILITAETDPAGMRKGMEEGADDYLLKPFTSDALLATVQATGGNPRSDYGFGGYRGCQNAGTALFEPAMANGDRHS
jgi:CheY-like chemotaxis protein